MSFESVNNPCPCESGLEYPYCCGAPDRSDVNTLARISDAGKIDGELPEGVVNALKNISDLPDLYPVKMHLLQNYVQWVKMSPYWYSESVFLDSARILGTCAIETSANWVLENSKDINRQVSSIIFHTAFCGSTLMSKALDAIYYCLPAREPDALSNLLVLMHSPEEDTQKEIWFNRVIDLLSRRYEKTHPVVIKTNDYANGLIKDVILRRPENPVLFMYTPIAAFFAGCVKADNRRTWVADRYRAVVHMALEVLPRLATVEIDKNSIAHVSAVYWSYNIALYMAVQKTNSQNLRSLNFEDMLVNPLAAVDACANWFGLNKQDGVNANDEMTWLLGVYSKDVNYEYSPERRQSDLKKLLDENAADLAIAADMAKRLLADDYPANGLPNRIFP